jgi:hypothetical protein
MGRRDIRILTISSVSYFGGFAVAIAIRGKRQKGMAQHYYEVEIAQLLGNT